MHHKNLLFYINSLLLFLKRTNDDLGLQISKILNGFFTSGYDKRVRPNYGMCFLKSLL